MKQQEKERIIWIVIILAAVIIAYYIGVNAFEIKVASCFSKCPDNWLGYSFDCLRNCIR